MNWKQLFIQDPAPNLAQEIVDLLEAAGAEAVSILPNSALAQEVFAAPEVSDVISAHFSAAQLADPAVAQLIDFLEQHKIVFLWQDVPEQQWERAWLTQYEPVKVSANLWIAGTWHELNLPGANIIRLDPGLAFGAGTHPTTFLCLKWLADFAKTGQLANSNVLDYGCGSGILGITAARLGANSVVAVDIAPQAVQATRANAAENEVSERIAVFQVTEFGELSTVAAKRLLPFEWQAAAADVVLANILAGPLIELAPLLDRQVKPGGYLVLSGMLTSQVPQISAVYQALAYTVEYQEQRAEWALLVLRRVHD